MGAMRAKYRNREKENVVTERSVGRVIPKPSQKPNGPKAMLANPNEVMD